MRNYLWQGRGSVRQTKHHKRCAWHADVRIIHIDNLSESFHQGHEQRSAWRTICLQTWRKYGLWLSQQPPKVYFLQIEGGNRVIKE